MGKKKERKNRRKKNERSPEKAVVLDKGKTNDQSEPRAISRAKLGVEESNFDLVEF